ncbi:hypothetical protein CBL_08435 [Carabus blaptoides fortunei]
MSNKYSIQSIQNVNGQDIKLILNSNDQKLQLLTKVKRERLLIIKSLGLQYSIIYHLGSKRTQFVPWDIIQKVLINEVITMHRVLYFLTIIHLRPRLQHLELIYSQINDILN